MCDLLYKAIKKKHNSKSYVHHGTANKTFRSGEHAPISAAQTAWWRPCSQSSRDPAHLLCIALPHPRLHGSFFQTFSFNYKPQWIIMQFLLIKTILLFGMTQVGHMMSVLMREGWMQKQRYEHPSHGTWTANIHVRLWHSLVQKAFLERTAISL